MTKRKHQKKRGQKISGNNLMFCGSHFFTFWDLCFVFAFKVKHKSLRISTLFNLIPSGFQILNLTCLAFFFEHDLFRFPYFSHFSEFVWFCLESSDFFSYSDMFMCYDLFMFFLFVCCLFFAILFDPVGFSKLCWKRYIWFIWLCDVCFRSSFMFSANFHCS